jgi:hypothetical protein
VGWWKLTHSQNQTARRTWILLTVATASLFWLLLGSLFPSLWGAYYGHLRFAVIDGNFLGMLIATVFSVLRNQRFWTGAGCLMLALIWAFVAAINSVA